MTSVLPVAERLDLNEKAIPKVQDGDVLWDAKVSGLHLRCFAKRKVFYLYYRTKAGKQRKPALGGTDKITLAQARKAAGEILEKVAAGRDPGAELEEQRALPTTTELWTQYRQDRGKKKKSAAEDLRMWEKYCTKLHDRPVAEIKYQDVANLFASMERTPVQANRVVAMLSTIFNFAIKPLAWITVNPCDGLQTNKERKRKRYMTMEEASAVATWLEIEAAENPGTVAFIWLLILTGARKGEIAAARWSDLQGNRLVLKSEAEGGPGFKTERDDDERVIYLSPEAMHVLDQLPRVEGQTITGIQNPQALWEKIRREAGCPDLHLHDLRHSFASLALGAGFSLPQVGELLGHKSAETTKRYSHLMNDAATAASAKIGGLAMARMTLAEKPRT